jgi:hypothetical protein
MLFARARSVLGLALFFLSFAAYAMATVEAMKGEVRAGDAALGVNQRVLPGALVTTGPNSSVILAFDDGQKVVLDQNTEFKMHDFKTGQTDARDDRSVFDLFKGALRVVTGLAAQRNRQGFYLRTAQATIGIRGTDFMVAIVNPTYLSVIEGAVSVVNTAGTVGFGAGSFGMVQASTTLAAAIPAAQLPAQAAAAFKSLGAVPVAVAGGAAPGAPGTAAGTAAGGVGMGTAAAVGAAIAAGAAALGGGGSDATTTHSTTVTHGQ